MKTKMFLKEKAIHGNALIPVAIHHLSYSSTDENYFYLHWHYEFEFIVVLEGAIIYTVEDQEFPVMAGEGLFVGSDQLHSAKSYKGMPCEACVVVFHPNLFGDSTFGSTYSNFIYPILTGELYFNRYFICNSIWQQRVIECLKEIDNFRNDNITENELLLKSRLFEIWYLCYKNTFSVSSKTKDKNNYKLERLQPVLDYIHTYYKEEIDLLTLSNILPMSKGQFCRVFKEIMNMPPIAYVIHIRILKSCKLLYETDYKIANIAKYVGFNNISYFNREFMKAIGCSPSKYRNSQNN